MKIIALSRQIGSYGDEIAALVARQLDYQLIDREEIHGLALACDPAFKDACALYEREIPKSFWERFFFNHPAYTSLFESLNYELASRGNVILMGRGAQIVLLNIRGVLRARIVAPLETRVERVMENRQLSRAEASEFVSKYGRRRRALIESIYNHDLDDWTLYDMIVNTRDMTPEEGAFIIYQAAKGMKPVADQAGLTARLKRMSFAKKVESAIRKEVVAVSFSNICVESPEEGRLVLTGAVPDMSNRDKAEDLAKTFEGVKEIDNQIQYSSYFSSY